MRLPLLGRHQLKLTISDGPTGHEVKSQSRPHTRAPSPRGNPGASSGCLHKRRYMVLQPLSRSFRCSRHNNNVLHSKVFEMNLVDLLPIIDGAHLVMLDVLVAGIDLEPLAPQYAHKNIARSVSS